MDIPILYEDDGVLVMNKPSGLVVHSDGRTEEPTLADWLLERYPDIREVGEPWQTPGGKVIFRPGIVHRLDRETSGVLVIAKTQEAFLFLKKQFQERTVEKKYRTFVYGVVKKDEGVIDRPIGKSRSDFRKWSAEYGARGTRRPALTEFSVLARGEDVTYLEVRPKTGRTHQIRVHMKAIGHPVVCDALYAPKRKCMLGLSRLALHAYSITFLRPEGEIITVEAPFSEEFDRAISIVLKE